MAFIQESHDLQNNRRNQFNYKLIRDLKFKRLADMGLSLATLLFLFPAFTLIAIGIKISSKGPVFFSQERYGLNKRIFRIWKFRTMTNAACESSFEQAQKDDCRVTKFGAFLRRTSLDEIPQFYNVIKGDMSIVGPRPHVMEMDDELEEALPSYRERFLVKPGITGLSQCKGFRGPTVTSKAKIGRIARDRFYVRERNLVLDFQIMLQTVRTLFTKDAF